MLKNSAQINLKFWLAFWIQLLDTFKIDKFKNISSSIGKITKEICKYHLKFLHFL